MWYQARGVYVAYAQSRDGIHWQKPPKMPSSIP
jgi:hypothetical protein